MSDAENGGSTKDDKQAEDSETRQEPTEVITETRETIEPDPSTPAQDVVDSVHDQQAENSTTVESVTVTTEYDDDTPEAS